tara:strand:- start:1303 stop:1629 length:327 start_codon:yes stop_codon:yes gene_type:complete
MKLSNIILKEDYWTRFKPEAEKLEAEMRDTYNRDDIHVNIIQHSNGDHARGTVEIMSREQLRNAEYKNMKSFLTAKGYRITGGSNFYDYEPNEREYFPRIKFEFDITG